jgi:hypothetical protein
MLPAVQVTGGYDEAVDSVADTNQKQSPRQGLQLPIMMLKSTQYKAIKSNPTLHIFDILKLLTLNPPFLSF